jgi:predicted dehydrogenase
MPDVPLKILQIGAGSMGSRRLRDLAGRSDVECAVFDARADRRSRSAQQFGVRTFEEFDAALGWEPDALVISSPPDQHERYVSVALELGLHHFSEANIWTPNVDSILNLSDAKRLISAPSCSLHFLGVIRELKRIVADELGSLHAYQMSLSTYMPSWHPQENLEYYARHRATSAGREMVPFELLWLNDVFGKPENASGRVARRGELAGMQEDVWSLQLHLQSGATGQLIVTMGSVRDCREGMAIGTHGVIRFNIVTGAITREIGIDAQQQTHLFGGTADRAALERAYFEEINCFIDAIQGHATWPLGYDFSSLATASLAACESSAISGKIEPVRSSLQPALVPSVRS